MNERIVERILARVALAADDAALLRRMAAWFDRASLRIASDNGAAGDGLELVFTDDADRYAVTLAELRTLDHAMRRGVPIAWDALRRASPPRCDR